MHDVLVEALNQPVDLLKPESVRIASLSPAKVHFDVYFYYELSHQQSLRNHQNDSIHQSQ